MPNSIVEIAVRNSLVHHLHNFDSLPSGVSSMNPTLPTQESAFAEASLINLLDSCPSVRSAKTFHTEFMILTPTRSARHSGSSVWDFDDEECFHDEVRAEFDDLPPCELSLELLRAKTDTLSCPKSPDRCHGFDNQPLRPGSARTLPELKRPGIESRLQRFGTSARTETGLNQQYRTCSDLDVPATTICLNERHVASSDYGSLPSYDRCPPSGSVTMAEELDLSQCLSLLKLSTSDLDLDVK